jgi:hypothetical protein
MAIYDFLLERQPSKEQIVDSRLAFRLPRFWQYFLLAAVLNWSLFLYF